MSRDETIRQVRLLMILRVVIVTTLLISAFAIQLLLRPETSLRPLFLLAAWVYALVLVYAALDRWLARRKLFVVFQVLGDAVVVTGFVAITGGIDSPMSFLYLVPIAVTSFLLRREAGLSLALACWGLYTFLVESGTAWVPTGRLVAPSPEVVPGRTVYFLLIHLAAFVTVALLTSYLAGRLRVQREELNRRLGAVARLQALNENIISSINSGLATTDLWGRVNFLNRGATEITGLSREQVTGRPVEEVFRLESGFLDVCRRRLRAHRRFRFEKWFDGPAGRRLFLGFAVSDLYDRNGRPLGFIFIFQDLTEIQALENQIRLKERMAALGGMAAGMAHELRNPLAAISGAVQYLKGSLRPEGETLELMDIILRESSRLDQTIRDFLTFARPGKFSPSRCDVVRLLEDTLKLLRKSHELRPDHRVETRYAAPEILCDVDPNRMKQVFWNLATNALKAMPDGGTLTVRANLTGKGQRLRISFADEGVGMDEREMESYFQPFHGSFRAGTGLGAAIIYRLVEEHGGRIGLDSKPGRGTRVSLVLPRYQARAAGAAAAAGASGTGGGSVR